MASRISQMRNAPTQMPSKGLSQEQIDYTRALMQQFKTMNNPEAVIMSLLQSNPQLKQIIPLLHNGNDLESIARTMAQTNGIDIIQLINQLGGM